MVCLLVCLFISCTSEVQEPEEQEGVPIELAGYLAPFEESEGGTRAEPAWMPDGYTLLEDVKSIGAFYTQTSTCDVRRIWWHDTAGEWYISGKSVPTGDFYLYGYLPYNSANVAITPKNSNYANGASLTFTDMSSVSTKDICVIVGASNGSTGDTPTSLQTGKFNCHMN